MPYRLAYLCVTYLHRDGKGVYPSLLRTFLEVQIRDRVKHQRLVLGKLANQHLYGLITCTSIHHHMIPIVRVFTIPLGVVLIASLNKIMGRHPAKQYNISKGSTCLVLGIIIFVADDTYGANFVCQGFVCVGYYLAIVRRVLEMISPSVKVFLIGWR